MTAKDDKVVIKNVNCPDRETRVDREKYEAIRALLLSVLPTKAPGMTAKEMIEAITPHLSETLWPDGEKVGWWQKTVQLDLEARGILQRNTKASPLKWWHSK